VSPETLPPAEKDGPWLRPTLIASWGEIAGFLLVMLAPFIVVSARMASQGSQHHYFQAFLSDRTFLLNAAVESSILGLGLIYLHRRGWTPPDLRIRPSIGSSLRGVVLVPIVLFSNACLVFGLLWLCFLFQHRDPTFLTYLRHNAQPLASFHVHLSWSVLIVAMILNAFLEEIVCTAYAFNQFAAKLGPALGLSLIVLLRMACHTYQGPVHALGTGMVFFIFGHYYWRTRNLWPLILAHALMDFSSISALKLVTH
jgi:membrane protease YdiL (CAAX protease family)